MMHLTNLSKPPTSRCEPDREISEVRIRVVRLNMATVAPDIILITCTPRSPAIEPAPHRNLTHVQRTSKSRTYLHGIA